jgi:hypothetical protein
MTEQEFQGQIKELAKLFGYIYYHTWRSIHSPAGFPDCVLARLEPAPRLIFIELKVGKNQPTPDQYFWLRILQHIGKPVECYLWYENDWDEIAEILR